LLENGSFGGRFCVEQLNEEIRRATIFGAQETPVRIGRRR
jgi:hypothetical protein